MKRNATKHALLMSVISLLLCMSMLVGTTFAWFTDSVTSANNIIASGNLDINLEYWTGTAWEDVSGKSDILTNKLWEPGVTEVAYLRITNAGSLALKYQMGINVVSETLGKNKANEDLKLSEHIQFGIVEDVNGETGAYANRDAAIAAVTDAKKLSEGYTKPGSMESGNELYLALVVYMPTTVGNEANHNGEKIPEIDLGINIFATQFAHEEDSFGSDYDEGLDPSASYLYSGTALHQSTVSSGKFVLSADIKTSDLGDDSRYGYGYEYIIRKGADYTLNLNDMSIVHDSVNDNGKNTGLTYLFVANNAGTKLTIEGNGKIYSHNSKGYACALQGKDGTLFTINGGEYHVDNGIAVWAGAGSHMIINGGTFVNANAATNHELIYSSGGVIDIYGGFFHNTDGNYTLNIEDKNRSTGFINVYGGTYVNFDPSTGGQDPNNIKVATGYTVVSETQTNGDVWYTVVPDVSGN